MLTQRTSSALASTSVPASDYQRGEIVNVALQDGRTVQAEVRRTFEGTESANLIELRFGTVIGQRTVQLVPRRIVSPMVAS